MITQINHLSWILKTKIWYFSNPNPDYFDWSVPKLAKIDAYTEMTGFFFFFFFYFLLKLYIGEEFWYEISKLEKSPTVIVERNFLKRERSVLDILVPLYVKKRVNQYTNALWCFQMGGLNILPNFQKEGAWQDLHFERGVAGNKGVTFCSNGGCIFYIKNKLKSEIINDKKKL